MRWTNVLTRFANLFGESVATGDLRLAARVVTVAFEIYESERGACDGLKEFLDLLESNELAALEVHELDPPRDLDLLALVADFEGLLAQHRHRRKPDDCAESPPHYVASLSL